MRHSLKRLLTALLLALVLVFTVACGNTQTTDPADPPGPGPGPVDPEPDPDPEPEEPTVGTVIDGVSYPVDPKFATLKTRSDPYTSWNEFGAHDPSMIKADDGKYYVFSTDVSGTPYGSQIRVSEDLIHWKYAGTAFDKMTEADFKAGNGSVQPGFNWILQESQRIPAGHAYEYLKGVGTTMIWAPDIVKGADGKYWLYYSMSIFGTSISYIGLAKSDVITGPYVHTDEIIKSTIVSGSSGDTPNCIDPQIVYEQDDPSKQMYMVYGSFSRGMHIIKLDRTTGKKLPDAQQDAGQAYPAATERTGVNTWGVKLTGGGQEGPVIVYDDSTGTGYYYLMTSYADLTSTYHMRYSRSTSITGPYVDVAGNTMTNVSGGTSTDKGSKLFGSYQFLTGAPRGEPMDYYAPGHNDLFRDADGKLYAVMHCRSQSKGDNQHYLFVNQLFVTSDGWLAISPNRYAGEWEQAIPEEAFAGEYRWLMLDNGSTSTVKSQVAEFKADGSITGTLTGTWVRSGDNEITLTITAPDSIAAGRRVVKGKIVPQFLQDRRVFGLSITGHNGLGETFMANKIME